MPVQTRCPSCGAALAPTAAWCSLCHADLRPKLAPSRVATDVVPGAAGASAVAAPASGTTAVETRPDAEPPVRGRHSRDDDVEPEPVRVPAGSGGRHAARAAQRRRPTGRRSAPAQLDPAALDGITVPAPGEPVDPAEVDALAEQMLSRLAVSEPRPRFLDPSDLPGGKALFIAGCSVALIVVLVTMFWVLGAILG